MAKTLIVASRVRELLQIKTGKRICMDARTPEVLTTKVENMIEDAISRAIMNGRTTVMPKDF